MPSGTLALILGLAFVSVLLAVLGVASLCAEDPFARRLAGAHGRETGASRAARPPRARVARPLARTLRAADPFARSDMRGRLLQAGFAAPGAVRRYLAGRALLALVAPLAWLVAQPALGPGLSPGAVMVVGLGLGAVAFILPGRWIARRTARRRQALTAGLPDALDMMVVCVEAGLGLDAALSRVGRQIAPAHPVLAAELALVALELRAGKGRADALRNLARRTGVPSIHSFVTLLVQSDALGTSIAQALRVQAEEMRANRMLRAEEMAHKLPVKLTVPLVVCVLPAMMAVVLLPGIITIVRDVLPHLGG